MSERKDYTDAMTADLRRSTGRLSIRERVGLLLILAAAVCFFGSVAWRVVS